MMTTPPTTTGTAHGLVIDSPSANSCSPLVNAGAPVVCPLSSPSPEDPSPVKSGRSASPSCHTSMEIKEGIPAASVPASPSSATTSCSRKACMNDCQASPRRAVLAIRSRNLLSTVSECERPSVLTMARSQTCHRRAAVKDSMVALLLSLLLLLVTNRLPAGAGENHTAVMACTSTTSSLLPRPSTIRRAVTTASAALGHCNTSATTASAAPKPKFVKKRRAVLPGRRTGTNSCDVVVVGATWWTVHVGGSVECGAGGGLGEVS
mmetsp:Transcript_6884/g.16264  ORF Transcript_6884/g.16264 Transcript_6884/m.16264 type:complete len:264 (-) Transcript_6884:635-1426(-)